MIPTKEQFGTFQDLYNYLNTELFNGELANCMLAMIPKKTQIGGHFSPDRWVVDNKKVHEISMNPHGYAIEEEEFFVSILAHEMCHLHTQDFSERPPRSGYHCKKWGKIMKQIGLHPSNTGEEGGKETGQQMTHYIIEGGLFQEVYARMDKNLLLPFKRYKDPAKPKKKPSKLKYTCPECSANVWGKSGLKVKCCGAECDSFMETEEQD